jgi:hypothetical protein
MCIKQSKKRPRNKRASFFTAFCYEVRKSLYTFAHVLQRESPVSYVIRHWLPSSCQPYQEDVGKPLHLQSCRHFFRTNFFVMLMVFGVWNGMLLVFMMSDQYVQGLLSSTFKPWAFFLGIVGSFLYLVSQWIWWLESFVDDEYSLYAGYIPRLKTTAEESSEENLSPPSSTSKEIYYTLLSVLAFILHKNASIILVTFSSAFFSSFLTLYFAAVYASDTFLGHLYQMESTPSESPPLSLPVPEQEEEAHLPKLYEDELIRKRLYEDESIKKAVSCTYHDSTKGPSSAFQWFVIKLSFSALFGAIYAFLEYMYTLRVPKRPLDIFIDRSVSAQRDAAKLMIILFIFIIMAVLFIKSAAALVSIQMHPNLKEINSITVEPNDNEQEKMLYHIWKTWKTDKIILSHYSYIKYLGITGYSLFTSTFRVIVELWVASIPGINTYQIWLSQLMPSSNGNGNKEVSSDLVCLSHFMALSVCFLMAVLLLHAFKVRTKRLAHGRHGYLKASCICCCFVVLVLSPILGPLFSHRLSRCRHRNQYDL